jgi:uncharacterized repeat protein (TIGR01451 family)
MLREKRMLVVLAIALAWPAAAWAADALQVTTEAFQEIETKQPDGTFQRRTVPAATVVPGAVVSYVVRYRNVGSQPADQVVVTNPVPKEMEFVSVAATPPGVASDVSVDGGQSFGELSKLTVLGKDGKPRPATAADVTQVRWRIQSAVNPGAEGHVAFLARLK